MILITEVIDFHDAFVKARGELTNIARGNEISQFIHADPHLGPFLQVELFYV